LSLWHWVLASGGVVFASSFDGFMTGIAYSIKGLRINYGHYWMIGFCTGTMMGISMVFGKLLASVMPDNMESVIGAAILVGLGVWNVIQEAPPRENRRLLQAHSSQEASPSVDLQVELNRHTPTADVSHVTARSRPDSSKRNCIVDAIKTVLAVFKEPLKADRDLSGSIDTTEAWVLSIALGLDAFAAGLGASVAGFPMLLIVISAIASPAFVYLGITAGNAARGKNNPRRNQVLAGIILIVVGLAKAFGFM